MKRFLKIFIPLVILGVIIYQFRDTWSARILPLSEVIKTQIFRQAPCTDPIPYLLGTFNTEFNISQKYFLDALTEAEAIWEKSADTDSERNLFAYAPEDSSADALKINLIYDYRQQATSKLKNLGIVVEENKASYEKLKLKFTALKADYEKEKNTFNTRVSSFNEKNEDYEKEVKYWNSQGGAPQEEFDNLEDMRLVLQNDSKELQNMQMHLNETVEALNALVVVLNRLASTLNISVDKYNTTNDSRGESFTEGVYYSEGLNREIDIYEFSSREKLVRVLAHELGHTLGLGHVDDPKAIMYELNQGNNMTLTNADLEALQLKCGE